MTKQRAISYTLLIIMVFILICAGCSTNDPKDKTEMIKIGAVLPLTGSGAQWGKNAQKGIDLALNQVNSKGGIQGKKVSVLYEDSQSVPNQAVNAFRKLVDVDKVQCSIVDMISSNVLAVAPIADAKKVVIISPGASSPDITTAGDYVFRNWPSDALQGEELARFVWKKGFKKVGMLYIRNEFGEGLKKTFTTVFQAAGGTVAIAESFPQAGTDFRGQISKVKGASPDAIVLFVYPPEGVRLIKQIKEARIDVQLFATAEIEDALMLKDRSTDGTIYLFPAQPDKKEKEVAEFLAAYKSKYDEDPGVVTDVAYDAFNLLINAIREGGNSGPSIQQNLLKTKGYKGASGTITFDKNGDVIKPFNFKIIKDGAFRIYEKG